MRHNPLRDSLAAFERQIRSREIVFRGNLSREEQDEDDVIRERSLDTEAITRSCERLFNNVVRSCDAYLISYYDFVLASQGGRTLENRSVIQEADESRRRSHVAPTANIRVFVRNLKIWGVDTQGMEAFVIEHDMDAKRRDIGNLALHFAFSRYISL
jgi:hypothetical protein